MQKSKIQKTDRRQLFMQIGFTVLAFVTMIVLSYLFVSDIIRKHLSENARNTLLYEKTRIESDLLSAQTTLGSFSEIIRKLVIRGSTPAEIEEYVIDTSAYLTNNAHREESFSGFNAFLETGEYLSGSGWIHPDNYEPRERPWYKAAMRGGGAIVATEPYTDADTGKMVITYARSINDDRGNALGVVCVNVNIDRLSRDLVEFELSGDSFGMLLGEDLTVLAHPSRIFIGGMLDDFVPTVSQAMNVLRAGGEVEDMTLINYLNEVCVFFFEKMPNGWYLGLVTPIKPYYESVDRMMFFICSIGFTLAAALCFVLYRINVAKKRADLNSLQKSNFLANMSHEIRTPMNAIMGMLSIGKSADTIERKDYCMSKIADASQHLLGVINDILDISKIEANKFELSDIEFNFEKMLRRVVNVINFKVDEKEQRFSVNIDNEIPKQLVGDDQRLAQVITNLLGNAVKFTPEGGQITLTAECMDKDEHSCELKISVADTGIGISDAPEKQALLFKPFNQAEDGTSRRFGGTGLGLSICKNIVELMGGKIWFDSVLTQGSTFHFTVRLGLGTNVTTQGLYDLGINWNNLRVLAVDDDPDILSFFSIIAEELRLNMDTAPSGTAAVEMAAVNGKYNIYFIDWLMPVMDGIELIQELKSKDLLDEHTVIIMVSAADWVSVEKEAKQVGVDKFLSKPLFISDIVDSINEALKVGDKPEPDDKPAVTGIFRKHTILIAEDVEINREIVMALLSDTLINVDIAETGKEAVMMYEAAPEKYSLILMDIQMPEMDGFEATRRIRASGRANAQSIPIIAMTANVFREDIERCQEAGMNDHLGKPVDIDDLMAKLRAYLLLRNAKEGVTAGNEFVRGMDKGGI